MFPTELETMEISYRWRQCKQRQLCARKLDMCNVYFPGVWIPYSLINAKCVSLDFSLWFPLLWTMKNSLISLFACFRYRRLYFIYLACKSRAGFRFVWVSSLFWAPAALFRILEMVYLKRAWMVDSMDETDCTQNNHWQFYYFLNIACECLFSTWNTMLCSSNVFFFFYATPKNLLVESYHNLWLSPREDCGAAGRGRAEGAGLVSRGKL